VCCVLIAAKWVLLRILLAKGVLQVYYEARTIIKTVCLEQEKVHP